LPGQIAWVLRLPDNARARISPRASGHPQAPAACANVRRAGGLPMQRKPDLLWILVFLFGLGLVTTGYAQSLWWGR
jgi:hypothetical protein